MSGRVKLTKAQRAGLVWFLARPSGAALFRFDDPSKTVRRRLEAAGLIERFSHPSSMWSHFRITDAGRAALASEQQS